MPDEPEPPRSQPPWDDVPEHFESAFVSPTTSKKPVDSPGFPLNGFGVLALAFVLCYVLIWASVGWYAFGTISGGWLGGIVGFLVFAVIGALIVPIVGGSLYYSFVAGIALLLFILADSLPVPPWARWVRTALRGGVIMGCLVCIFLNVPTMLATRTDKERKETALLGVFLPVCVIGSLYFDRMEKLTKTKSNAGESS